MKKILVVGGTGFLGSNFLISANKKYKLYSISTKIPPKKKKIKKVKYLICDISSYSSIQKIINFDVDYVVNFGGYVDHTNKVKTYKSHFIGCKNLVDFFKKKQILKFVQVGSSLEYINQKSPHVENNSKFFFKKAKSTYVKSKLLATKYCLNAYKQKRFPVSILRPYLIYGPGQETNRLIPYIISNCLKGNVFNCSEGNQIRNFLFVNDFIKAIFKIIKSKSCTGQIINIGSEENLKVKLVINKIQKLVKNGQPLFGKIKLRKDEIINSFPNINKIKNLISWYPSIDIDKGLLQTINYFKNLK